jgi:hypothetical protein
MYYENIDTINIAKKLKSLNKFKPNIDLIVFF